jgi:hypothetical protein
MTGQLKRFAYASHDGVMERRGGGRRRDENIVPLILRMSGTIPGALCPEKEPLVPIEQEPE